MLCSYSCLVCSCGYTDHIPRCFVAIHVLRFILGYRSYPQMLCSYSCVLFDLGIRITSPDALFLFMCCVSSGDTNHITGCFVPIHVLRFIWGYESYPQMMCSYSRVVFHLGIQIISPDALFLCMCCVLSGDSNHIPRCLVPIHVLCFFQNDFCLLRLHHTLIIPTKG